jgi:hypothetical protein
MNYLANIILSQTPLIEFITAIITIPIIDLVLCQIFGTKSRWFQLHSVVNGIIMFIILDDVVNIFSNPMVNIKDNNSKIDSFFIMILHIYHLFIVKQITLMDYFHHILFIGFGVIPSMIYYNNNLIRLAWLPTCGITGCIEYFTLSLVKHGKLESIKQKRINSYIYNYIRYPCTIIGPSFVYVMYKNNFLHVTNIFILIYFNCVLFFNGAFYNKITIENYILHKYKRNNSFNNLQGYHS